MRFEFVLIVSFLFLFAVFLIPDLETAIGTVSASEELKPLFTYFPIAFIGCVFLAIFYVGYRHD